MSWIIREYYYIYEDIFIFKTVMKKLFLICTILVLAVQTSFSVSDVSVLLTDNESEFGAEFLEALRFSYDNWLTKFKTVDNFRPYDELTREQAAKIVWVFASKIMNYKEKSWTLCNFTDLATSDSTLSNHITDSCKLWIFKWTNNKEFFPKQGLTKAEALAVVIRMFNQWLLDEQTEPWYLNYYLEARQLQLTKEKNIFALERPLTRYEMVLLLYRFHVKYSLLEKLNSDTSLTENNDRGIKSVWDKVVIINSPKFLNKETDTIFSDLDWIIYRLDKSNLIAQFDNAYTWYWDVYFVDDVNQFTWWKYVWVSTFNFINQQVTDGNIRPIELHDWYYEFAVSDIKPFYQVKILWETNVNDEVNEPVPTTGDAQIATWS